MLEHGGERSPSARDRHDARRDAPVQRPRSEPRRHSTTSGLRAAFDAPVPRSGRRGDRRVPRRAARPLARSTGVGDADRRDVPGAGAPAQRGPGRRTATRRGCTGSPGRRPRSAGSSARATRLDVPFVFHNLDRPGVQAFTGDGEDRIRVADEVAGAVLRFASDGKPGWDAYELGDRTTGASTPNRRRSSTRRPSLRELWAALRDRRSGRSAGDDPRVTGNQVDGQMAFNIGSITDVPGVRVGHAHRVGRGWLTGTTVVSIAQGAVPGVDVRGGGPGTRGDRRPRPAEPGRRRPRRLPHRRQRLRAGRRRRRDGGAGRVADSACASGQDRTRWCRSCRPR